MDRTQLVLLGLIGYLYCAGRQRALTERETIRLAIMAGRAQRDREIAAGPRVLR